MVTQSSDMVRKIHVATLLHAEEIGHKIIDGEGYSQIRGELKLRWSLYLFSLLYKDRHTWDRIEQQLFPQGSSVLNTVGKRVRADYDDVAAVLKWEKRIEAMK